jgi:hypothetical protein
LRRKGLNFVVALPISSPQILASTMPLKFAVGVRACCLAAALVLVSARAADQRALIGATREQVLARFGEPKSNIVAGNREILFFPTERVVLRNNVVVEAEELASDSAPRRATTADAGTTGASSANATPATPKTLPAPNDSSANTAKSTGTTTTTESATQTTPAPTAAPSPEPQVQIKSVRPPSVNYVRAPVKSEPAPAAPTALAAPKKTANEPVAAATATSTTVPSTSVAPATKPAQPPTEVPPAAAPSVAPPSASPTSSENQTTEPAVVAPNAAAESASKPEPVAASPVKSVPKSTKKKAVVLRPASGEPEIPDPTESIFTAQTYVIAFVTILAGAGYLWWRYKQRQIAMVATAVSNSPFAPAVAASGSGTRFTPELLGKLEWKRFEDLVAAYYNKTGVVATRTKTGPNSPVHIRISWKGEPRPFACVQCIARPAGLIDATPIQALADALTAEDIRRGYVVTTGKFSVAARDLAEEKHFTLMSGDIFLDKLNALPDPARAELMKDVTVGDYMTPTCPTCDVKMARAPEDPSVWKCPQCSTVLPRA